MRNLIVVATLVATLAPSGAALADEVIIHRDAPVVVEPAPPREIVIERRRPDCTTTTEHRENGLGDSTTTTRHDCD